MNPADPKVQAVLNFKVGQKVSPKGSVETFEVIAITPDKKLKLRGCAGVLEPSGFEQPTPPAP